jgi:hypothetical protein
MSHSTCLSLWDLHMYTSSRLEKSAKQTTLNKYKMYLRKDKHLKQLNFPNIMTLHLLCVHSVTMKGKW